MKKLFLLFILALSGLVYSQKGRVINSESTAFTIPDSHDPVDFLVMDTKLDVRKPVFLWCQGSLPYPLYVRVKKGMWLIGGGIGNFDVENIKKYYHLVIVSMPETPLVADESEINDSYWYVGNSKDRDNPTMEFQRADYLENYTRRALKVLKFLRRQPWVDRSKLVVAGHSQGSKVATKIALLDRHVTRLGLFGANPFGRIDQNIRSARKDAEGKKISWAEADRETEKNYGLYRDANDPEKLKKDPGLLAWKSFSEPLIGDWLRIKSPIYLAYGTDDIASDLCDLVPLYFIRAHKDNLTYRRYPNMEHNFFDVDEKGSANEDKPHWKEVMNAFVDWTLK